MAREIREHVACQGDALNQTLLIQCDDRDPIDNASHAYTIITRLGRHYSTTIEFQHGPTKEAGVNGVSDEAVLCILIDRLKGFQSGQYSCRENSLAVTKLEEALHWLQARTRDRIARAVEGTTEP